MGGSPKKTSRLLGVDATRGLALLGMMAVHVLTSTDADGSPSLSYSVAAGRSAAIFAVLAGVGIAFMTRRTPVPAGRAGRGAAISLAVRALAIGAIGLALGYTEMVSVILPYYALLFLLAIPLVFLPTRTVLMVGLAAAVVIPVVSHAIRDYLPDPLPGNPSFEYLVEDPGQLIIELLLMGIYPVLPWMAYLCAGLAIGRMQLSSARVAATLFGAGFGLAVAAAATSWVLLGPLGGQAQIVASASQDGMRTDEVTKLLVFGPDGTTPTSTWWWLAVDSPHSTTPLDLLHTIGVAAALLGALLLLSEHLSPPALRKLVTAGLVPCAAIGSMTLTLYTAHVMFISSPLDLEDTSVSYALQVIAAMIFAVMWRTRMQRGPLETLVAWLAQRARGERPTPLARSGVT